MCLSPLTFLTLSVVMTISEGLEYRRACQEGGHLEATVTRFEMMDAFLGW